MIFKSWFVDFEPFGGKMPEDWEIGYLENIADITMGQSPDGKSYNENKMGMLFFQGRAEFGFRYPAEHLYTTEPKRLAQKNDILLSVRAPVGDINIAAKRCCIGRGLAAISSKNNFNSFLLYTMLSLKSTLDLYNGEGTVFGSINRDSLNELKITLPAQNIIANFERLVFPIDIMIKNNCQSIVFLKTLRDTLLPKFMTGENEDVSSLNYHLN